MNQELPADFYKKIHSSMPIVCVDVVVFNGTSVLLIRRETEPEKGTWWFPGGRLMRGEKLKLGARRIVKNETNLDIVSANYLGIAETHFDTDPFGHGNGTHTVNAVFLGRPREASMFKILLDDHHSDHKWVEVEDIYSGDYHVYVKQYAALAAGVLSG